MEHLYSASLCMCSWAWDILSDWNMNHLSRAELAWAGTQQCMTSVFQQVVCADLSKLQEHTLSAIHHITSVSVALILQLMLHMLDPDILLFFQKSAYQLSLALCSCSSFGWWFREWILTITNIYFHENSYSKKCWVVSTQIWVKYGQAQMLG